MTVDELLASLGVAVPRFAATVRTLSYLLLLSQVTYL